MRLPRWFPVVSVLALAACGRLDSITGVSSSRAESRAAITPPLHDPILFVHGWNSNASVWTTTMSRFTADGWTSRELASWSYDFTKSNATTAGLIARKVDSILAVTGASHVDLVTHSMGALSARYYIKNLGGAAKVGAFVALGGTNHGTNTAFVCFETSCLEMWPGSSFLRALNATDETWGAPRYATWWSPCDEVILPQASERLSAGPSGTVLNTATACMAHERLHEDYTVDTQVRDFLRPALLASRSPGAVLSRQ